VVLFFPWKAEWRRGCHVLAARICRIGHSAALKEKRFADSAAAQWAIGTAAAIVWSLQVREAGVQVDKPER
jgi:hypothetical protein